MRIGTLGELLREQLRDLYDAECQLLRAIPRMADCECEPELQQAFRNHLIETERHVGRLEEAIDDLGFKPKRVNCEGMLGLGHARVARTLQMSLKEETFSVQLLTNIAARAVNPRAAGSVART